MSDAGAAARFPAMSIEKAHAVADATGLDLGNGRGRSARRDRRCGRTRRPPCAAIFQLSAPFGPRDHLVLEDERATVSAFRKAASALAHRLIADGVKTGDRVALIMRNLPEWPVAF